MGNDEDRIAALAAEIGGLWHPITAVATRARGALDTGEMERLEGRDRATIRLPCEIGLEALGKCEILVTNNVVAFETLGVIALTRYVFELLIWLRTIKASPLRSLNFLMLAIVDSEAHTRQHRDKLVADAQYMDALSLRDDPVPNATRLVARHGDALTAEIVRAAEKERMDELDREARRHFTMYAEEARTNGYGFQAAMIRRHAVAAAETDLVERAAVKVAFIERFGHTLIEEAGGAKKLNWAAAADALGMNEEYEYVYRYTSRLLHASPTSFYTTSKNIEASEMRIFLEYVYVRLLDVIEVVGEFIDRAESALPGSAR